MCTDRPIVVTGAAGFIGSALVRHLNDKGYTDLILVDDLGRGGKWKNLRHKRFRDMMSRHMLFDFLKGNGREVQAFIHLGANSSTTETNGDLVMEMNYRYSVRLATYALENNLRFIYASSAATYGDGSMGFADDEGRLDLLRPLNLYGFSKHLFDKWLQERGVLDRVVGLKYFNIYGPNEYEKGHMASMVMHMTSQIRDSGKVRLFQSLDEKEFQDGEQRRDFFYVKDAVKMTCFFLEHDLNGIFNVGSGQAHSWNQMAGVIFDCLGKKAQIEYIPMPEHIKGTYQNYTCADLSKFDRAMKKNRWVFSPDFSFKSGIRDYLFNYLLRKERW